MATRSMGPAQGWHWLVRAVNLGSRNARAVFGGASLLLLVALVPTLVQLFAGALGAEPSTPGAMGGWMVFSVAYSIVVMPPAMAGLLRVIHAAETGAPTRAGAVFDGYRAGAGRIIGLMGAMAVMLVVAFVGVTALVAAISPGFGEGMAQFLAQLQAASASSAAGGRPALPSPPDGFGMVVALLLLLGLFFNGVYALAVGQVALGDAGIVPALRDGIAGTLKNLLPLCVMLAVALVVGVIAGLLLLLVMSVVLMLGSLVHASVGVALMVPIYVAAMLVVYVVAFGVMYFMWRDICADGIAPTVEAGGIEA